jgi:pimeloyl-ACP methyl ester carboxylesterase
MFVAVCAVFFTTYFSKWFVALALAAFLDIATNFSGIQRGLSLVIVFSVTKLFLFLSVRSPRLADLRAAITTAIYGVIWPLFVYDTSAVCTAEFSKLARIYYRSEKNDSVLVFIHGGGWCTGDIQDWLGHRLASLSKCAVVLVTYPKCSVPVGYVLRTYAIMAVLVIPVAVFASTYTGTFYSWLVVALPIYAFAVYMLSLRTFEYTGQKSYYKEQVDSVTQTLDELQRKFSQAKFSFVGHSAGAALLLSYIVGRLEADKPIGGKYVLLSGPYDFVEMQKYYNSSHFANVFGTLTLEWVSPLHRLARCNRYVLTSSEAVYAVTSQSDFPFLNEQSTKLATTWTSVVRVVLDSERGHGMGMISDDRVWKKVLELIM